MLFNPQLDSAAAAAKAGEADALKLIVTLLVAESPFRGGTRIRCAEQAKIMQARAAEMDAGALAPHYQQAMDATIAEVFDLAVTLAKAKTHV